MIPKIRDCLLTPGSARGRSGKALNPKGIVVHYTGNAGSSALANRNYFESGSCGNKVSAHYIVGLDGEILRLIPENERAAHAGKSYGAQWAEAAKTNNSRLLGVEVCHPTADGMFNAAAYRALVGLIADICVRFDFDVYSQVYRHYDVSGKSCPLYYVRNQREWNRLRNAIFAGTLVNQCFRNGLNFDPNYWERVLCGEIVAEYDYLTILEERICREK